MLKILKKKLSSQKELVELLNITSNRNFDRVFQTEAIDSKLLHLITNKTNANSKEISKGKQQINKKLDNIQNQETQVVEGFNNNAVLQNKIWKDVVLSNKRSEELFNSISITLLDMKSKLLDKVTTLFNAYLKSHEAIQSSLKMQRRFEIILNETKLMLSNGFLELNDKQKSRQKNNTTLTNFLNEQFLRIETGVLEYHKRKTINIPCK